MSTDQERRSRLLSLKLRALVRDYLALSEEPQGTPHVFAPGAAFVTDDAAWFLIDGDATRSLGGILAWCGSQSITQPVHILTDTNGGIVARRAKFFNADLAVWQVQERTIVPVEPMSHVPFTAPRASHLEFAPLIESAGADLVIEHGVVLGEVRGLEMCRVVDDQTTGETRLEVGMGAHDREAFAMVHGHVPTEQALRQVIDAVSPHRMAGAPQHPFNQFGAERLLRWTAMQDPSVVGCSSLAAAEPPVVRTNLKDAVPCVASGLDENGATVAVTFVMGIDLDAVPFALDAADRLGASRAALAMRTKDLSRPIRMLVARASTQMTLVELRDTP